MNSSCCGNNCECSFEILHRFAIVPLRQSHLAKTASVAVSINVGASLRPLKVRSVQAIGCTSWTSCNHSHQFPTLIADLIELRKRLKILVEPDHCVFPFCFRGCVCLQTCVCRHPARHINAVRIKVRSSLFFTGILPLSLENHSQAARIKQILNLIAVAHESLEFA